MELKSGTVKTGLSPLLALDSVGNGDDDKDDDKEGRPVEVGGGATILVAAGGSKSTRLESLVTLLVMEGGCIQMEHVQ